MAVTGAILVDSSVLSKETQKIRFIISKDTTAQEIISKVLLRFNMNGRDPNLFYITMEPQNKTESTNQTVKNLGNSSHPLELQLLNGGNSKFTIQMRSGGVVKVYDNCLTSASFYKSMFISKYTTSYQLIQLLLNHYGVKEGPENFLLAEIDDNGKELNDLSKNDCPLLIQQRASTKTSFSLKRVQKTSNLIRPHSFHGEEQRPTGQHINTLRRSLRKKSIRFDFDQTDQDRQQAIEELRSNLHELTSNKESVFYNVQRSQKITLDKNDHKEFLRAKMEKLKQRKLFESRRHSDQSVFESLEAMFQHDDVISPRTQTRLHRTSRVENDRNALNIQPPVNGYNKENRAMLQLSGDEDSYPGREEEYITSSDSSGAATPVLNEDFDKQLGTENVDVEGRLRRGSVEITKRDIKSYPDTSDVSDGEMNLSRSGSRRNTKPPDWVLELGDQGHENAESKDQSYNDFGKTPLVTPRTPFMTPRVNMLSDANETNTLGVPSSDPFGSPTPTASGRGSRISNASDCQSMSFDSSGAPTPTPRMEDYSSVEKESFTQAVKAKNTMAAIDESRELEKTLQSSGTESDAESVSKVKNRSKSDKSHSPEKNTSPRKHNIPLPDVGSTPVSTPRIDLKKLSKSKPEKSDSKSSGQDSESDSKQWSRSNKSNAQGPPQNTAKRKDATRGRIQNPDTPPQTPRHSRSRTHSTETPVRNLSRAEDTPRSRTQSGASEGHMSTPRTLSRTDGGETPRSRTQSRADETPLCTSRTQSRTDGGETPRSRTQSRADETPMRTPRQQSRTDGGKTPRSRTQSRADETPLRTPRTQSRTEESADEMMTQRSRSSSIASQSSRSDVESQGQKTRRMPSARSNVRGKGTSLSDSEGVVQRQSAKRVATNNSRSEESLRKSGSKVTDASQKTASRDSKGPRTSAVRRPVTSGYSSDKTAEKTTTRKAVGKIDNSTSDVEKNKAQGTRRKNSSTEKAPGEVTETKGDKSDRRASSTKEFREIVTDRLYQLSRTPSTRRKNYKPPQAKDSKDEKENLSPERRSSVTSSAAGDHSDSTSPPGDEMTDAGERNKKSTKSVVTKVQKQISLKEDSKVREQIKRLNKVEAQQKADRPTQDKRSAVSQNSSADSKGETVKSKPDASVLRKMNSLTSEDDSVTDGSMVSDADNTSAKESMTSDLEAQEKENALQRKRRRRPRRALPAIPTMADVDLEERKKQLFTGAKQRLQRVYAESNYDSESSMNRSDLDSQSERGEENASRASTLTGRDEDERLPLYLISASCPDTEDTGDDRMSIDSSAFESPKSDDEEIMNVISRGKERTNFTAEVVPPILTKFSQPPEGASGSKSRTHTEEQIYRAKQNLLRGINVTFKNKSMPNARGYRTEVEDESLSGKSTARGYISDQGNRVTSGYDTDQSNAQAHVNAGNLGPLVVKSRANTINLPQQLVSLDPAQEKLIAAKYQYLQQQLVSKQGHEIEDPLTIQRQKRNYVNTLTQTDFKISKFNRPSLQKVLQSCDLITISIFRGRYLYYGIRLFEGVFQPLSSRHSLRSPRGKRPLIGQNKSAFSRVQPMANEDEIESIISVDRIGDRTAAKQDGRVQEGDYIMEVNGKNVMDHSLMEVQGALEASGTKLELVIARTKVLNLAKEDVGLVPHTDLEKELEKLKLKYNNVLEESHQKDRLIEELRSVIVKKAQIRQVKDGVKNCKINIDLLEGECSAV